MAPSNKVDPEILAEAIETLRSKKPITPRDSLAWARDLRRSELECKPLTRVQRAAWREALRDSGGK